jgi:Putative Actinobacterial Holin-X, holin superfamily III
VPRLPAASSSPKSSGALPANTENENLTSAVTEVSEQVSVLIREEIELARAEVTAKVTSLARGAIAVAAGAVFGLFGLVLFLETMAWVLNAIITDSAGSIWVGFMIVTALLFAATIGAFLFAYRKLKVGAPKPDMAIDEAKKIRATVSTKSEV